MNRIDELGETWEKAYKGLVKDLGNERTFEEVAADESMIEKCCDLVDEFEDKFKKEMAKCL